MSEKRVINKWFWAWEDDKEEQWLTEMSEQGWHLAEVGFLGRYTFLRGEPVKEIYRMDFLTDWKNRSSYLQLFSDAGWEHVSDFGGWQYFRKPAADETAQEIFTDVGSKVTKYQRVFWFLLVIILVYILPFNVPNILLHEKSTLNIVFVAIWALFLGLMIFGEYKINQRIR
ncbi:MAG: DUF2812 domain-containing protein, partial [Anaerolineaceae bacterium]|nr:DUF2812 domain-containing protein [Anaerolineaceae bacterium]